MHHSVINLIKIKENLKDNNSLPNIIAVSKTFSIENIIPLIEHGHLDFGENKVQEAIEKWSSIKKKHSNLKLHMIGKLQTNKVKYVLPLFDFIHSLDNLKLAEKISNEQDKQNLKIKIFIQVNVGKEPQKSGLRTEELDEFYNICTRKLNLNIIGLMCLPPKEDDKKIYFEEMQFHKNRLKLSELSMGMSEDYIQAYTFGATYLRIGSKIFGKRI
jgi:pyridoxal phosphate enzyme (YggS family)